MLQIPIHICANVINLLLLITGMIKWALNKFNEYIFFLNDREHYASCRIYCGVFTALFVSKQKDFIAEVL